MSVKSAVSRAHSVRDRLLNLSRADGISFELVTARYAQERFLFRLSRTRYHERFLLKGGLLFSAVTDRFGRATRDIDLSADIETSEGAYCGMIRDAAMLPVADNGVVFDPESISISRIILKEDDGFRATLRGVLGVAKLYVQVDASFNNPVMLPEQRFVYPSLLNDVPAPVVRAYSVESMIAEKFEAITSLGLSNTRYKDFDDIWQLAATRSFHATALFAALSMTYNARGTAIGETDLALSANKATPDREAGWTGYRKRAQARHALTTLTATLERLRSFWAGIKAFANDGLKRIWEGGMASGYDADR